MKHDWEKMLLSVQYKCLGVMFDSVLYNYKWQDCDEKGKLVEDKECCRKKEDEQYFCL